MSNDATPPPDPTKSPQHGSDPSPAASGLTDDEAGLAELGYKQELKRGMSGFGNFAVSF